MIIGGNRFRWYDIDRNDRFISAAIPILRKFWESVCAGDTPPPDSTPGCKAAIGKLYPADSGGEIILPATFDDAYAELSALKTCAKALEKRRDTLENAVKVALAENTTGRLSSGAAFTWKTQTHRKAVHCPNCQAEVLPLVECRVLRQHNPKHEDAELQEAIESAQKRLEAITGPLLIQE